MTNPPSLVCSTEIVPGTVDRYVRSQVGPTALTASTGRAITNGENKTRINRLVAMTIRLRAINARTQVTKVLILSDKNCSTEVAAMCFSACCLRQIVLKTYDHW